MNVRTPSAWLAALLSAGLAACSGTPRGAAPASALEASERLEAHDSSGAPEGSDATDTSAEAAAALAAATEPGSRQFGEGERALLCGAGPVTPGAATLEKVLERVERDDRAAAAQAAAANKASETDCKTALDTLDNTFEQVKASSRSSCDYRAARGIGVDGEALLRETQGLLSRIDSQIQVIAAGNGKACATQISRLTLDMERWRGQRDLVCAVTPEQNALIACGVEATDPNQKRSAESFCKAVATPVDVERGVALTLEQCVARALGDAPPARAAAERSAEAPLERLPTLSSSLQTTLLRGSADFFAERAQREVTLFAYDVVTNRLCDTAEVEPFLKNTCELLGSEEILAPTPSTLREAVRADFDQFPRVLVEQIKPQNAALACAVAVSWSFGEEAIEGADVLELLGKPDLVLENPLVGHDNCSKTVLANIRAVARELAKLLENRPRLERAVKAGAIERAVLMEESLRSVARGLNDYGQVSKEVMLRVRQLDQASSAWTKSPTAEHRAAVVVAGLRTIDPILHFAMEHDPQLDSASKARAYTGIRLSIELTGQLINHDYGAGVVTGAQLGTLSGLSTGKARNLLGLAASLAQAESSDDVRITLEQAALPLGSWRRKNESRWGVTLTGMVGAQFAYELVVENAARPNAAIGGAEPPRVESGPSVAPSLLVGADIHHGFYKDFRAGVQLGVLDLGALLSVRVDDPKVDAANATDQTVDDGPELRVEQLFSPGVYPYIGWGPFDVGIGASFVPALRTVDTPTDTQALDVFRLGVFMAVDVSVLPLL
jgi:hypothetical protein